MIYKETNLVKKSSVKYIMKNNNIYLTLPHKKTQTS